VYGSDLILPRQFLKDQDPPSDKFNEDLRNTMIGFRPVPTRHNTPPASDLPEQIPVFISTCPMVLVRKVGHMPPLAPLYEEPCKVP